MRTLFITGTDAQVGKTVLVMALMAYWQTYCRDRTVGILKPVQTGGGDRDPYSQRFALNQTLDEINPIYFEAPLPVPIAAAEAGRSVELEGVWKQLSTLQQEREIVLVESVGGLGSPLTKETTVADLAWDWRLPTVLVVPVTPGAIAQAVAHVALARQSKLHLKGIVLNCITPDAESSLPNWAPQKLMQSLTQTPVLGCLPYLSNLADLEKLAIAAANLDLERFLPALVSVLPMTP